MGQGILDVQCLGLDSSHSGRLCGSEYLNFLMLLGFSWFNFGWDIVLSMLVMSVVY